MSDRTEIHGAWTRVALTIGVGVVVALAHGKADDAIGAMLITYLLLAFVL